MPSTALASLTLAATVAAAVAQDRPAEERFRFAVGSEVVALDVVVTDKKGRFVRGLERDDFLILEDGVPQTLSFFTADVTPVTVLLLLDSSASVRANLDAIKKAANRFLGRLRKGDRARVGFFHERVSFGPRYTDELREHIAMIRNMRPQRKTLLYDALLAGLRELGPVEGRKAMVVFTDGEDAGSVAGWDDVERAARRSHVTIYTIGFMGWTFSQGMSVNRSLLSELADLSGGRALFPGDEKEMRKSFDRIEEELHRQYRMAYEPVDDGRGERWRSIEVRLPRKSGLTARTRKGYFWRPPAASRGPTEALRPPAEP